MKSLPLPKVLVRIAHGGTFWCTCGHSHVDHTCECGQVFCSICSYGETHRAMMVFRYPCSGTGVAGQNGKDRPTRQGRP